MSAWCESQMPTSFKKKCEILGEFWEKFNQRTDCYELIENCHIGFSLALKVHNGNIKASKRIIGLIEETWIIFCLSFDLDKDEKISFEMVNPHNYEYFHSEVENEIFVSTNTSHDSPAIASDKALKIPENDLFESTQYTLRKLAMLWELAREEGFQDSEDNEGISLDMFISSQMAILVLKRIIYPTDRYMKAFRRASQEFEELLGFPSIEVSPLDVELVEPAESNEYINVRYLKGLCYLRPTQDRFDIDNFRSKFSLLFNEAISAEKASNIFVEIAPGIIDLLWQAFAKLGFHFYCNHFEVNYDEDFGLFDFDTRSAVYNGEDFFKNIGTPSWAEVFIEFVDRDELLNDWGDGLLDDLYADHETFLLYAQMHSDLLSDHYAMTEDNINWYWPKMDSTDEIDSDIVIIQSHSRWWGNSCFYNNISYGVTPDLKYIDELEKVRGISYAGLSSVQIMKLINIATETLEHPDIGLNKVAHYILSLIWSYPDTPMEGKVSISLLSDEYIRNFREDVNSTDIESQC